MGMEDRDYYWEDRKRRENKFDKKDTHYRPKEFRRAGGVESGKPPNDWQSHRYISKKQWKFVVAFLAGCFLTFWGTMFVLIIEPDLLWHPFNAARILLNGFGVI